MMRTVDGVSQGQASGQGHLLERHRVDSLLFLIPLPPRQQALHIQVSLGLIQSRAGPGVAAHSATVRTSDELLRVGTHSMSIPSAGENQLLLISGL